MRCCVPYCNSDSRNYDGQKDHKRSMHEFPKDEDTRNAWINAIGRLGKFGTLWEPATYSVVCSYHFTADSFKLGLKRRRLLPYAIPSIFEKYPARGIAKQAHLKRFAIPNLCLPQTAVEDTGSRVTNEKSSKKIFHSVARKKIKKVKIDDTFVSSTNSTYDEKEKQQVTSVETLLKLENNTKRNVIDETLIQDEAEDEEDNVSFHRHYGNEDIFGQYVASEIRNLKDDLLLYLQTKKAILEAVTRANFELINSE